MARRRQATRRRSAAAALLAAEERTLSAAPSVEAVAAATAPVGRAVSIRSVRSGWALAAQRRRTARQQALGAMAPGEAFVAVTAIAPAGVALLQTVRPLQPDLPSRRARGLPTPTVLARRAAASVAEAATGGGGLRSIDSWSLEMPASAALVGEEVAASADALCHAAVDVPRDRAVHSKKDGRRPKRAPWPLRHLRRSTQTDRVRRTTCAEEPSLSTPSLPSGAAVRPAPSPTGRAPVPGRTSPPERPRWPEASQGELPQSVRRRQRPTRRRCTP